MEFAKFAPDLRKDLADIFVLGYIAGQDQRVRTKCSCEFLHVFLQAFTLVGERKGRSCFVPGLRNRPRDGTLVGHPKNNPEFARENIRTHYARMWRNSEARKGGLNLTGGASPGRGNFRPLSIFRVSA